MDENIKKCDCLKKMHNGCSSEACPLRIIESFSSICHDLKTPLSIILSSLQVLELYEASGKIYEEHEILKRYFKLMRQNSFRLIRLVNNILDLTKIESDLFSLELINEDIVKVIRNITYSVMDYASSRGIKLAFSSTLPEKIMAFDPDKIERIVLNLISNALKFTPDGGKIEVKIKDKGEKVILIVQDNGIGMTEDEVREVFNKYRHMKKNYRENEGTGLGLSLVKKMVEKHDGIIYVESKIGRGTKFNIELPVRIVDKASRENVSISNIVEKINIEFSDIYSGL